jgi:hypothetical protein
MSFLPPGPGGFGQKQGNDEKPGECWTFKHREREFYLLGLDPEIGGFPLVLHGISMIFPQNQLEMVIDLPPNKNSIYRSQVKSV